MSLYFFHIRDGQKVVQDEEGMELPNLDAARFEAEECARDLLINAIRSRNKVGNKQLEVVEEHGSMIATIMLRDLLD